MRYYRLFFITLIILGSLYAKGTKPLQKDRTFNELESIDNPELQAELETLKREFDQQRQAIVDRYEIQIENLKNERKNKINVVRKDFAERRKVLFKKYGVKRVKPDKVNINESNNSLEKSMPIQPDLNSKKTRKNIKKKKLNN